MAPVTRRSTRASTSSSKAAAAQLSTPTKSPRSPRKQSPKKSPSSPRKRKALEPKRKRKDKEQPRIDEAFPSKAVSGSSRKEKKEGTEDGQVESNQTYEIKHEDKAEVEIPGPSSSRGKSDEKKDTEAVRSDSEEDDDEKPKPVIDQFLADSTVTVPRSNVRQKLASTKLRLNTSASSPAASVGHKGKRGVGASKEEDEKVLKDFDLNGCYGACRGISRSERYERAIQYNLHPPPSSSVVTILSKHCGEAEWETCIWDKMEQLRKIKPNQ